ITASKTPSASATRRPRPWRAVSCRSTRPRLPRPNCAAASPRSPCASTATSSTAAPTGSPTSPTSGPSPATPPRAIPTGSWLRPKPDSERMAGGRARAASAMILAAALAAGAPALAVEMRHAQVAPLSFELLDGWTNDDLAAAFATYQKSCGAILQATPAMRKARPLYGGLYTACEAARTLAAAGPVDREAARKFFEDNFKPVRIEPHHQFDGFFTGYYETEVDGSRTPTDQYKVPLYSPPKSLIGKTSTVFGGYDRKDIEAGALKGKGLEICYVKDPADAFFAQIQGSTRVKLDDGTLLRLNYIAS